MIDPTGAALSGATVGLVRDGQPAPQETVSDEAGRFFFAALPPGPVQVTVRSEGFATQSVQVVLHPGEACVLPPIALAIAPSIMEMRVELTQVEIAAAEIKEQEKQRVLGFIPNFYVSYLSHPTPLTPRQKFHLAWKTTIDPVNFGIVAAIAGVEQAQNDFGGYGQGAQGYGKRYGAAFADSVTSTFIGSAILPSLLKQDPRYFYKGTGSIRSRIFYALANAVICKSDKGRWQANYSGIMGSLASGGISNLYYPAKDRGAELVFENTLVGIGASAAANIFQEFVVRRLTPAVSQRASAKP